MGASQAESLSSGVSVGSHGPICQPWGWESRVGSELRRAHWWQRSPCSEPTVEGALLEKCLIFCLIADLGHIRAFLLLTR